MKLVISFIVALLLAVPVSAYEWQECAEIERIFNDAGVKGTFVLFDAEKGELVGYNEKRANTRFIPASTFKIANTLIGLSVGAVKDVDEILPYGGGECFLAMWERDMSLRDAIAMSNVPIYQELARRIGNENMKEHVKHLHYGNQTIGEKVDTFWLQGPLKISAIEQVTFLYQLAQGALPYSKKNQKSVREIIIVEKTDTFVIHAKTGMSMDVKPAIGWWVGWIVKENKVYPFALNIEPRDWSDKDKRVSLGKAALKALGVFES